jgi:predicted acyl esterase
MPRFVRFLAVTALIAGLLPTTLAPIADAHHDPGGPCQTPSRKIQGYIPVAQGTAEPTTLHYQVLLPNTDIFGPGPFESVMDYSGYEPGITIYDGLHRHFLCQGYAVIGLNIRGTGCSGGEFDYFEPRQAEDGRDGIRWFGEHAAELGITGRIAMVGKSYPGITQLFVAGQPLNPNTQDPLGTQPKPDVPENLVAIVPGAVFSDLYRDVPFPGGIMNVTFAAGWSAGRIYEPFTAPLDEYGAIQKGDQQCIANTAEHVQNPPQNPFVKATYNQYDGNLFWERSPYYWAQNISVPTFLFETWQDEQVGSRATALIERFKMNPDLEWRFLGTNGFHGGHGDYYGDYVMPRIDEFLDFYLDNEIPAAYQGGTVTETAPQATPSPSPTPTLPNGKPKKGGKPQPSPSPSPSPSTTTRPETFTEALARYEASDPVQINWENGAGGEYIPAWTQTYASWPPPNQEVWRLNFTPDGGLTQGTPPAAGSVDYRYQPGSSQERGGYVISDDVPGWENTMAHWSDQPAEGTYAMFTSDALSSDKLMAGPASVDLWLSSTAPDTDLQVTLTEVRPDGQEMFIQQGWLRASHRKENADPNLSTALRPYQTHLLTDVQPLVPGTASKMRLEIFPFAHAFRAGSKIRLYVEAPHVKPDLWGFALLPIPALNTIETNAAMPSSVAFPLLAGDAAKVTALPGCTNPGLRNQPCRDAVADN